MNTDGDLIDPSTHLLLLLGIFLPVFLIFLLLFDFLFDHLWFRFTVTITGAAVMDIYVVSNCLFCGIIVSQLVYFN